MRLVKMWDARNREQFKIPALVFGDAAATGERMLDHFRQAKKKRGRMSALSLKKNISALRCFRSGELVKRGSGKLSYPNSGRSLHQIREVLQYLRIS